ncbi:hypothetical protein PRZ48_001854 [Zasmidium cellare]|uniref:DUF6590 domain-containing protein n=1 Tax=Zasmidium cellare TaxID=395010 RepID=A0ABR0F479_ZASCE|nr:hypothetical protein PRZ48_001854 [Zasmidium cellare]
MTVATSPKIPTGPAAWRNGAASTQLRPQTGRFSSTQQSRPFNATSRVAFIEPERSRPSTGASTNNVPSYLRTGNNATPSAMGQFTHNMGAMGFGGAPRGRTLNASKAPAPPRPAPSMITCHFPGAGAGQANSMATIAHRDGDKRIWRKTAVCVHSPWTRLTFTKGDVLSLPYHVANLNPTIDPQDKGLTTTEFGPVLSKRRMVIVLYKFKETMFCVPLYSFTGRGIGSRKPDLVDQYIQLMDVGRDPSELKGTGAYEPLEFKHAYREDAFDDCTTVHITGGKTVSWQEDIELVGRLTERSYFQLVRIWRNLNEKADREEVDW